MKRYIFFANSPSEDGGGSEEIRRSVKVLSESGSMMLVEGEESAVEQLAEKLPDWKVSLQQQHSIPEVRPALRRRK